MSDKLKQLEIKKLLTEYDYLIIDEEMKQEIIDEYKPGFMEGLGKETSEEEKEEQQKSQESTEKKELEKLIKDEDLSEDTKKRMKKMFREIMKKTHPDKVKSEELIDIYIKSKEAYDTNNLLELSYNASKLNISIDLSVLEIEILKDLIKQKRESLETIEKSWLWMWYKAGTETEKDNVIKLYYLTMNKKKNNNKEIKQNIEGIENLEEILNEIYKTSPYLEYTNKTHFKEEYNDLYGEVTKKSTNGIVRHFKEHFNKDAVFYDLGCGLGKMVLHIGLQYKPKKSCGIELSKERIKGANDLKEKYCKDNNIISFIKGDFFKNDLGDATIVYLDNTVMSHEITKKLIDSLPKGCLFICRKKPTLIETETLTGEQFKTTYHKTKIHFLIKE